MIDDRELIRHLEEGGPDLFDRPEPPALDLAAITGQPQLHTERADRPAPRRERRWNLRPLVAVSGAMACIGAGLVGGALLFGGSGPAPSTPTRVAATAAPTTPIGRQVSLNRFDDAAPADAAAEVNVFTATDGRTVDLRVKNLPVPPKGQFYELWVLGDAGKMISLGIVRVDASGTAEVRMPLPVSLRRFPVFDLSLEPGDGNPAHSGQSIMRSAAAA